MTNLCRQPFLMMKELFSLVSKGNNKANIKLFYAFIYFNYIKMKL